MRIIILSAFFLLASLNLNAQADINQTAQQGYFNSAYTKYGLGDFTGAIQDYSKAIKLDPAYPLAYVNRGLAKDVLGDYTGAIQDCSKAIELNPDHVRAYFNRGLAKDALGDKDGGCLDLSKAKELGDEKAYDLFKEYCK